MNVKLRSKKLSKGVIRYYLDIYADGKRTYDFLNIKIYPSDLKSVKAEKKKIAELTRANRELELLTDNTNYIPKHLKNVNFFDFADNFINTYKRKDVRMLKATLTKFKKYINNPELKGLLKTNPTKDIKFRKTVSDDVLKKQVLNANDLQTLSTIFCGNQEVKKAFLFACYTGLGIAEIKKLTWQHIIQNKLVTHREKTKQKIEIKLKEGILNLIGERTNNKDTLFNLKNEKGIFLSTNAINKCIKNWVNRAKIEKHITFYCARHTFATQLLQYGANLKTVSDALGHTTTRSTIKYLNYIDNLKDEAIDNLPDIKF